jgi:hypothetical protein
MLKNQERKLLLLQAKSSCKYQNDLSIDSIKRYVRAVDFMKKRPLSVMAIYQLGEFISPKNGEFIWRTTPATFRDLSRAIDPEHIIRALNSLVDAREFLYVTPEQFFIEFEKIHPFNDGNGRVGEILYWKMTGNFSAPHSHFSNHD